jgi:hypothetical protein
VRTETAVHARLLVQPQLGEQLRDVHLDGARADDEALSDPVVAQAFCNQPEDLHLPLGEGGEGVLPPAPADQRLHDGRIDDALCRR